jgi:signal transduction histidine kinase
MLGLLLHYTVSLFYLGMFVFLLGKLRRNRSVLPLASLFLVSALWAFGYVLITIHSENLNGIEWYLKYGAFIFGFIAVLTFLSVKILYENTNRLLSILSKALIVYAFAAGIALVVFYKPACDFSDTTAFWGIQNQYPILLQAIKIINNLILIGSMLMLLWQWRNTRDLYVKRQYAILFFTAIVSYLIIAAYIYLSDTIFLLNDIALPDLFILPFMIGLLIAFFKLNLLSFSENRVNKLLNTIPLAFVVINSMGKVSFINKAGKKSLDLDADLIGEEFDFSKAENIIPLKREYELPVIKNLNTDKSFSWGKYPVNMNQSLNYGLVHVFSDITSIVKLEEKLHEANQTLEHKVRKRTTEVFKRDAYLRLNNEVSSLLLRSSELPYQEIVDIIGKQIDVSRVYIFVREYEKNNDVYVKQVAEYVETGISSQINNPVLLSLNLSKYSTRWVNAFNQGKYIRGAVKDFPSHEKDVLLEQNIKSLLVIPLVENDSFFGFIGFDDCYTEKEWSKAELDFLGTIAENISIKNLSLNYYKRLQYEKEKYNLILENIQDGVIYFKNNKFEFVNKNLLIYFGLKDYNEIIVLNDFLQFVHKTNKDKILTLFSPNNKLHDGIMRVDLKNASNTFEPFELNYTKHIVNNEVRITATLRNLSRRFKNQEIINNLNVALNLSPNSVIVLKSDFTIAYANNSFYNYLHIDRNITSIIGQNIYDVLNGIASKEILDELIERALQENIFKKDVKLSGYPDDSEQYLSIIVSSFFSLNNEDKNYLVMIEDITDRKMDENEIIKSRKQIAAFSESLIHAIESERKSISRELHDNVGQNLTALKLDINYLRKKIGDCVQSEPESKQSLIRALNLTNEIIDSTRKVSQILRPRIIDNFGLVEGMRWFASEYVKSINTKIIFSASIDKLHISDKAEINMFRIFQEILTNIVKHAKAKTIKIDISRKGKHYILIIEDDGIGFDFSKESELSTSHGLIGMQERIKYVGGKIEIESIINTGTKIVLTIPYKR